MSSAGKRREPVTVVVPTHDDSNWVGLADALSSLAKLTEPPETIVVAVDHNPPLAQRVRRELGWVTAVDNHGAYRGASATRNAGAAAASTSLIAFLDDDEIAEPEWLSALVAPFSDPRVVGTGGRYVAGWDGERPTWFPDELAWVVGVHHSGMPSEPAQVRNVWSGNMAVRADVFHMVDGFREGFGKSGSRSRPEDTDLCIRMAHAVPDGRWIYVPDARIVHTIPSRRSTFDFYLRRCYAEGAGKIDMRDALPGIDALDTERDYLRRTIPRGVRIYVHSAGTALGRGQWRDASTPLRRAAAVVVGIFCAGLGAASSAVRRHTSKIGYSVEVGATPSSDSAVAKVGRPALADQRVLADPRVHRDPGCDAGVHRPC